MDPGPRSWNQRWTREFPWGAAGATVSGGLLVLAGWYLDVPVLRTVFLPGVPVKATTALGLVLVGLALGCLHADREALETPGRILAGLSLILGLGTVAEWTLGRSLGFDTLAFREAPGIDPNSVPGRPVPLAGLCLTMMGAALLVLRRFGTVARALAGVVAVYAFLAIVGYAQRLPVLGGVAGQATIATATALSLLALAVGVLFTGRENRFRDIATSSGEAGRVLRTLLPLAVLLPVTLDFIRQVGRVQGLIDSRLGAGIMVSALVTCAVVVVSSYASALFDREQQHESDEERLRQAGKLEAIGRLAGGVAHDFNNLLTVITGSSERLEAASAADPEARAALRQIQRAAERATRLTRQLLAFGRKQHLEARVIDLAAAVEEAGEMLRRLVGDRVLLETRLGPGRIRVDPGQLDQVLLNLAANARDAMPQGGRLVLETAEVRLAPDALESRVEVAPGPYMVLRVIDQGTGMDEATVAHLFEPFYTTKEKGKGTGLGLATVFGIVKQSGGHLGVLSTPGAGTTFEVFFPRVDGPLDPHPSTPPPRPAPASSVPAPTPAPTPALAPVADVPAPDSAAPAAVPGDGAPLLLVEDEDSLRELFQTSLVRRGYRVLVARDGGEALALSRAHPGPLALLVSDLDLPVMGGAEVWAKLKGERPGLRAIFMSGYAEGMPGTREAIESCFRYLQKPFPPRSLVEAVRAALESPSA